MPTKPFRFTTPEEFKRAAQGYFDWCDSTPIRGARTARSRKDEKRTDDELLPRPYTIEGMIDHLGISNWTKWKQNNYDRKGFAEVIDWALNKIRRNQLEGGIVNLYNPNLTARLNGIAETVQEKRERQPIEVYEWEKRNN